MTTLNSLLGSLKSSSNSGWGTSGASGWGSSSSTWGGSASSSYVHLPALKRARKKSESQQTADAVMAKTMKDKKSHSGSSFLDNVIAVAELNPKMATNLVKDIVSTAENLPSGLLKTVTTNPLDTAKAVGADYSRRYSPLFHGQFKKFGTELINHPLAPALDAFTVATLGAGTAAKAGLLSGELQATGLRTSRALEASTESPQLSLFDAGKPAQVEINLSRNPATRQLQKAGHGLKRILPERIPVVGESASAKRALGQQYLHDIAGQDAGARSLITKDYVGKYGEGATQAIQNYAQTQVQSGMLGKATQVWKDAVLAGRPAFQINNFVGNQLMFHGSQGLHQASASKSLLMSKKGELNQAWDQGFKGSENTLGSTEAGTGTSTYRKLVNKSYNLQGKGELWLRKAVMRQSAMAIPEVKALVRKYTSEGIPSHLGKAIHNKKGQVWAHDIVPSQTLTEGEALARALKETFEGPNGAAIHRQINQGIEDALGNYNHYNKFEAGLKKAVPFYGWNRHSTRFLYATARDRPGQLLAMNELSKIGEKYHNDTGWAGTPDFMKGYLNIGGHVIDTAPLNPVKGATDTLKAGQQLLSGDVQAQHSDLASSLNPFATGIIQALTGKNLLTGAPVKRSPGGLVGSVLDQTVEGLPQTRLLGSIKAVDENVTNNLPGNSYVGRDNPHHFLTATGRLKAKYKDQPLGKDGLPVEPKNRHMLNKTFQSAFASFVGIPDRGTVNKKVAKEVAKKIETERSNPTGFHAAKKRKKTAKKHTLKSIQATQRSAGWGASSSNWGS